ncbi:MAG: hypothetical protein FWG87_06215 [Defluviitaleaceae bacterium]|nr:hypothetical protein [Defluviitaleaceae bacterium]
MVMEIFTKAFFCFLLLATFVLFCLALVDVSGSYDPVMLAFAFWVLGSVSAVVILLGGKRIRALEIVACLFALFMFVYLGMGIYATFIEPKSSIEIPYFKDERHIQEIEEAIQFRVAPHERLYVEHFIRRSRSNTGIYVLIVIEGITSVEHFLARFDKDISEVEEVSGAASNHLHTYEIESIQLEPKYEKISINFTHFIRFYSGEDSIYAKLHLGIPIYRPDRLEYPNEASYVPIPDTHKAMFDMLHSYFPEPTLLNVYVIIPAMIQAVLILFVNIRVIRRIKHPTSSKAKNSEEKWKNFTDNLF